MHFKQDIPCGIEGAPTAFFLRSFTPAGNQPHLENLGEEGRESLLYCGREVGEFRAKLMQRGVPQFKIFPNPPRGDCGFFVFSALQMNTSELVIDSILWEEGMKQMRVLLSQLVTVDHYLVYKEVFDFENGIRLDTGSTDPSPASYTPTSSTTTSTPSPASTPTGSTPRTDLPGVSAASSMTSASTAPTTATLSPSSASTSNADMPPPASTVIDHTAAKPTTEQEGEELVISTEIEGGTRAFPDQGSGKQGVPAAEGGGTCAKQGMQQTGKPAVVISAKFEGKDSIRLAVMCTDEVTIAEVILREFDDQGGRTSQGELRFSSFA